MERCILWGMGKVFQKNYFVIKYYESVGSIQVAGITAESSIYEEMVGYPFVDKCELRKHEFDIIIVMTDRKHFHEICKDAEELGLEKEKLIPYDVLTLAGFDLDKYLMLKKNPPSIFSNNCWGGFTYHSLGLEFTSPLINMFVWDEDYIKLIQNPRMYMEAELEFLEMRWDYNVKRQYPAVMCEDVLLHFNHYKTFEEAKQSWEKRKKRINWDNLFVEMYTVEKNTARAFDALSYKKKVCFVSFESEEKSSVCVNTLKEEPIYATVNEMAKGNYPYYDVVEMLGTGKISKVSQFKKSRENH